MIIRIPNRCGECSSCEKYKDKYVCRYQTNQRVIIGSSDFSKCVVDPLKLDENCHLKLLLMEVLKFSEVRFDN